MDSTLQRTDDLSPVKRALLELREMRAELETSERLKHEPIAIIGLGCRFPGAPDPASFWELLCTGGDAIMEVPAERWPVDAYYDPDLTTPGKMVTRYGGFLPQVDQFDAHFFGISSREAASMDPQQRLLLEVSWEALEHAGQVPAQLAGSPAGVFVGMSNNDYSRLLLANPEYIDAYCGSGNAFSAATGRISYFLGLHGPSLVIDTACSSSLVAVHLACQSLRAGECRLALAGGVNLMLVPEVSIAFSKAHMLAADGHCKTFDAAADGYVRGEGGGMVVLKRLADAQADGDRILALVRATAINQDGYSNGLTAPNGLAQEALLRRVLAQARLAPAAVSYVEAHGTGTALGDPIEVQALGAVYGEGRAREQALLLGSVKSNIGHLEAAAGIAGLIKVVLALQHQEVPPQLHLHRPNPHITWGQLPVRVATQRTAWPVGERVAGVSAFGFSGTNAHVLVAEAPASPWRPPERERPLHLLSLSAQSREALQELAERYTHHLGAQPSDALADICFTANVGRTQFGQRLAVVSESTEQLGAQLAVWAAGQAPAGVLEGQGHGPRVPEVVFLFPGQGAQYVGMGRQLYETQPTFRQALERCDEILRAHLEQSLLSVVYPEPNVKSSLEETTYALPALFALEYALATLWQSWGITPGVVLGHGVGEYVAACIAGVFSLEDGLQLIAERARLMQTLPQDGAVMEVCADVARVNVVIEPYRAEVALAAINAPQHVVLAGRRQALAAVAAALASDGIKTGDLTVSHAFNSPLMETILEDFERIAQNVSFSTPRIGIISNLSGVLATDELATAAYWRRHVCEPVRFAEGMATLHQQGYGVFVEVGPQPILLGLGRQCVRREGDLWLPSLRQGQADWQLLLQSLGALYVRDVEVDWQGFDHHYPRRKVAAPTYPFQRQRYWIEPATSQHTRNVLLDTLETAADGRYEVERRPQLHQDRQLPPDHLPEQEGKRVAFPQERTAMATLEATASRARADHLIQWLRSYAQERINSRLIDERRCIPPYIVLDLGNRGILGMQVPEQYGGLALSNRDTLRVFEQLAAIDLTLASFVGVHHALGTRPIMHYARPAVRDALLPRIAQGRELAAFAVTEPGAGSNPAAMAATAVPDARGGWRLHGQKVWIGSGAWAGAINVFVQLLDANHIPLGITGFVVRQGTEGLRQGPEALTMGMRGMVQNAVDFHDVPVDAEHMLGEVGGGMDVAQDAMMYGRLGLAALSVGGMKRCAQLMHRYATRRSIATGRLLDNPITLIRFSELMAAIGTVETLVARIAECLDQGGVVPVEAYAACKTSGPEFLSRAADHLVQMLGGRGYIETNIAPQILRDARLLRIFEGPTETLNMFLGSRVINKGEALDAFLSQVLGAPAVAQSLRAAAAHILERCTGSQAPFTDHTTALRWAHALTGDIATFAILWAATQGTFERSGEEHLRRASEWARLHFEQKCARALSNTPAEVVVSGVDTLTDYMAHYAEAIGDLEQTLAAEAHDLDTLLRRQPPTVRSAPQAHCSENPPQGEVSEPGEKLHDALVSSVSPHTAESIQNRMVELLARKLHLATHAIDRRKPFADYGLDSVIAVELIQAMEDWLQRPLEVTLVWSFPTIELLACHLAGEVGTPMSSAQVHREQQLPTGFSTPLDTLSETEIAALLQEEITTARQRKAP